MSTASLLAQDEAPHIALADFQNSTGEPAYDQYTQGLPESIGTFIARSGMVQLVERNRLQEAINEQLLAQTGYLDEESAAEVGRIVGARAIILGSFLREADQFQVNARMIDTETGQVLTAEQAYDREILKAADKVAVGLLRQLGIEVIETKKSTFKRIGRWMFFGVGIGGGLGAFSANTQGDDAFDRYLGAVREDDITRHYQEAKDKDAQRDLLVGVSPVGMLTAAYLYLTSRQPDRIYRRESPTDHSLHWHLDQGRILLAINRHF